VQTNGRLEVDLRKRLDDVPDTVVQLHKMHYYLYYHHLQNMHVDMSNKVYSWITHSLFYWP